MDRKLITETLKWVGLLIVMHIAAMLVFGFAMADSVAETAKFNAGAAVKKIVSFDIVVWVIFALIYLKIESSFVEYRKSLKDSLKEPKFSLIKHWKNTCFKVFLIKMCAFFAMQIPFVIFYAVLGFSVEYPTFIDEFYVMDAGFYALTSSPILGLLINILIFGAIYFTVSLFFMLITKKSVKKDMIV